MTVSLSTAYESAVYCAFNDICCVGTPLPAHYSIEGPSPLELISKEYEQPEDVLFDIFAAFLPEGYVNIEKRRVRVSGIIYHNLVRSKEGVLDPEDFLPKLSVFIHIVTKKYPDQECLRRLFDRVCKGSPPEHCALAIKQKEAWISETMKFANGTKYTGSTSILSNKNRI